MHIVLEIIIRAPFLSASNYKQASGGFSQGNCDERKDHLPSAFHGRFVCLSGLCTVELHGAYHRARFYAPRATKEHGEYAQPPYASETEALRKYIIKKDAVFVTLHGALFHFFGSRCKLSK
jgi:hypothetical protein